MVLFWAGPVHEVGSVFVVGRPSIFFAPRLPHVRAAGPQRLGGASFMPFLLADQSCSYGSLEAPAIAKIIPRLGWPPVARRISKGQWVWTASMTFALHLLLLGVLVCIPWTPQGYAWEPDRIDLIFDDEPDRECSLGDNDDIGPEPANPELLPFIDDPPVGPWPPTAETARWMTPSEQPVPTPPPPDWIGGQ
jgi:hypothetical protein